MPSSAQPTSQSRSPAQASLLLRIIYPLATALLLGAWLTAAFTHLDFWAFEDDEGTFLLTAPGGQSQNALQVALLGSALRPL